MKLIRSITATGVVLMLLVSVFAGTAAAAHDPEDPEHNVTVANPVLDEQSDFQQALESTHKAAATRVRKAFLQAKKAFHESRQEFQAIKKLEESPVEDVPTFFDAEGDDDDSSDEEYQDGSDPELNNRTYRSTVFGHSSQDCFENVTF